MSRWKKPSPLSIAEFDAALAIIHRQPELTENLSTRVLNCMAKYNITSKEQLKAAVEADEFNPNYIRNLGNFSFKQICRFIGFPWPTKQPDYCPFCRRPLDKYHFQETD